MPIFVKNGFPNEASWNDRRLYLIYSLSQKVNDYWCNWLGFIVRPQIQCASEHDGLLTSTDADSRRRFIYKRLNFTISDIREP